MQRKTVQYNAADIGYMLVERQRTQPVLAFVRDPTEADGERCIGDYPDEDAARAAIIAAFREKPHTQTRHQTP